MPVIAVVNRKGGSGKSTIATHLAAYCANAGLSVMLGDVDHQQSTQTWLRLRSANRSATRPPIVGWAVDPRRSLRAPAGTTHVILDTPGGLTGLDLARVAMFSDVILMPVCNSVFDRESAAACHAELLTLPRVANGRCRVAAVGMRLDARTRAAEVLRAWAGGLQLPFVGVLRDTQAYVRCIETGMTLFDLPALQVQADLLQWGPILRWLNPVLHPTPHPMSPPVSHPMSHPMSHPAAPRAAEPVRRVLPSPPALQARPALAAAAALPTVAWSQESPVPVSTAALAVGAAVAPTAPLVVETVVDRLLHAAGRPRPPVDEPPVLTVVVPPARPTRPARPRLHDDTAPLGALAHPPTLTSRVAHRMRGLLDLGPIFKRAQRSA